MNENNSTFLPLDPMDRPLVWFESTGQMMIQLELKFANQLDADRLADAALLTLEREPVLKCRLSHHWFKPSWRPVNVEKADLVLLATSRSDYETFKQTGIDTYTGPQIRICLWNQDKDAQLLRAVPKDKRRSLRRQFHTYMKNVHKNHGAYRLPFENGKIESPFFIQSILEKDKIDSLIRYGHKNAATLNDLLISAFFRSQVKNGNWDGQRNLRITTTIDMRRHLEGNKASAVSNLSLSLSSWPDLGNDLGDNFADTLSKVTAITRRRKENYFGLDACWA